MSKVDIFYIGVAVGLSLVLAIATIGDEFSVLNKIDEGQDVPVSAFQVEPNYLQGITHQPTPASYTIGGDSHEPLGYNEPSIMEEIERAELAETWDSLTFTLWCEARGGGEIEMRRVGSVIYYRAQEKEWDYSEVIHKPWQFSCLGSDGQSRIEQTNTVFDQKAWERAALIAIELIRGEFVPNLRANHYYAHKKIDPPSWSTDMRVVAQTQHHTYLYK